jgi:hypothetical protein
MAQIRLLEITAPLMMSQLPVQFNTILCFRLLTRAQQQTGLV